MKIDNQTLRLFANSMAACLSSGLTPKRSLELSGAGTQSKALRAVIRVALDRCDQGMAISEALEPGARAFPHFFLPVIRAGEAGGRLVEAFQLLDHQCRRIGPSVSLVRNTWLYPLICIVFGWIIRTGIFVYFGRYDAARHFVCATFGTGSLLILLGWLLFKVQPVKRMVDLVLLQIPLIRETELRLAVVLFFATFRLAYEAGGLGVVVMFDLAWRTVRNDAIRQDLLKTRRILAENGTFGDAFGKPALLEDDLKGLINTGSISGKLDRSLTQIVEMATQQLETTLRIFNQFFHRLVAITVAMSIVETVLICIL
ncbi:MAG: type II secretion system F family protein [Verrucomicrobiia bacterium]